MMRRGNVCRDLPLRLHHWLLNVLVALCFSLALVAQSFDRLLLRPRSEQGATTWTPGYLRFYDSQWPGSIEYVGLQALAELERYTLTLPPEAPVADSCIVVDTDGLMSFVPKQAADACRAGKVSIPGGDVGLNTAEVNARSFQWDIATVSLSGIDPFWVRTWAAAGNVITDGAWLFAVAGGLSDPPVLTLWVYSSSGVGTDTFEASVGCVTPRETIAFDALVFDTANAGTLIPASSGRLHLLEFDLDNRDGWQVNDLCLVNVRPTTSGNLTFFLWMEIR